MKKVSFNMIRSAGIKTDYAKPEYYYDQLDKVRTADLVLFPEYWMVNSIIYGLNKPIFPSPATYHLGHDKIEMTRAFKATFPHRIPKTLIYGKNPYTIERVLEEFEYPFVAKTAKSSMGQGVWLIKHEQDWLEYVDKHDTFYVQQFIPNDRDLRIIVIGEEVVGSYWRVSEAFLNNVAQGAHFSYEDIPESVVAEVLDIAKTLHINHAAFDVIVVEDEFYILEFNVFFGSEGLMPLGVRLPDKIAHYLDTRA
ncbi:ATP-grasp domain-containing protein [Exiguobacterium aurantiacum]|uniref:ATP-grasp domain-containing protein n=1 Tax=Exiguobacterium aurantiacum TaxID=33987 RepID=A0ABY5FJZ2_9BACL|nr:ATP-grasp domain-containing protein [Exiguobacterium aurantiacum]UTT41889.1 ATP-grasp domain-containing protein [Exiguobacterium aurantiacum]